MAANTGRESDKFMLRLPDGMRDQIKTAAEANGRSMNAEIIHRLEESFYKITISEVFPDQDMQDYKEKDRPFYNAVIRAVAKAIVERDKRITSLPTTPRDDE